MSARIVAAVCLLGTVVPPLAGAPPADSPRRTPLVRVIEECRDAVVNISTTRVVHIESPLAPFFSGLPTPNRRVQSVGSGVIAHESGYIVTNAHVVAQASDVYVTLTDQENLPAEVVAADREHDLAVLKVKARAPLKAAKLGRSDDILVGETVVAIGNPLGLQHSVTAGIISAVGRDLAVSDDLVYEGLIQTDTPINPGNSGGPLLNLDGELIGINTAIRGDAQNIGFAIPVDRLWELLPELLDLERRERVRVGVKVRGKDAEVTEVRPDTPAARAGLKTGDRVVEFDGRPLRDGIDYYVHLLGQRADSEVKLKVRRDGKVVAVAFPLQSIPLPDGAKLATSMLGISLTELTPELRRKYELPDYIGLMVLETERASPAARARLRPGDFVVRLDRTPVLSLRDVGLVLEQVQAGKRVAVDVMQVEGMFATIRTAYLPAREKP